MNEAFNFVLVEDIEQSGAFLISNKTATCGVVLTGSSKQARFNEKTRLEAQNSAIFLVLYTPISRIVCAASYLCIIYK